MRFAGLRASDLAALNRGELPRGKKVRITVEPGDVEPKRAPVRSDPSDRGEQSRRGKRQWPAR